LISAWGVVAPTSSEELLSSSPGLISKGNSAIILSRISKC